MELKAWESPEWPLLGIQMKTNPIKADEIFTALKRKNQSNANTAKRGE